MKGGLSQRLRNELRKNIESSFEIIEFTEDKDINPYGKYILVIHDDIVLTPHIDKIMIEGLKKNKIVCPNTTSGKYKWNMPIFQPNGISQWCFMMKSEDWKNHKDSKDIGYCGLVHHFEEERIKSPFARIPKIIHQMWIGKNPNPFIKEMNDWKEKNPSYEYHLWTDENLPKLRNKKQFDKIKQWCGKGDILRYELLYDYGGIYIDSDTVCVNPLDDFLLENESFVCWESEVARPGLMASTYIGANKGSKLAKRLIYEISKIKDVNKLPAWQSVGPLLLSECAKEYPVKIYPSGMFMPNHYTGIKSDYKGKVYADHLWHSTKNGL